MKKELKFVFLLSSERSGSNFLLRMLDAHPRCLGPAATHIMRIMLNNYTRYSDFCDDNEWKRFISDLYNVFKSNLLYWNSDITEEELSSNVEERNLASVVKYIYGKEALSLGKDIVIVKENCAYELIPYYIANFHGCKFIYLVRDPRDMALSWKKIFWYRNLDKEASVREATQAWKKDQYSFSRIYLGLKDASCAVLTRYEDILKNPENEMKRICKIIEMDYDHSMLNFFDSKRCKEEAKLRSVFSNLDKPILSNNYGKYKKELDPIEIKWIEAFCNREMHLLGYSPDYEFSSNYEQFDLELQEYIKKQNKMERDLSKIKEAGRDEQRVRMLQGISAQKEIPLIP